MLPKPLGCASAVIYPASYNADSSQRYYNEVHVCNLLRHRGVGVVAFVGAYNTEAHPFGLIYEYMDGLDLKQYIRDKPYVKRLKLVQVPLPAFSVTYLTLLENS